ncbi:methionyl-tRNA formyltransferase [Pseudactinotalea sp. HY160]|uniref:methionyl-tRNA formyltransferase n=1 Tax=Pseudactinotalea sp. HY160 TaxID=2654490 RepID=UPI00128DB2E0|nr:methionyl-tRNA formyltransferase [Pseudactinotalea sp. HY160]MPV49325.1 methionyl-tRNA formyltransferase [Pseudactinotalea sp. HY160]
MRLLFAGTPAVAVPALGALLESEHEVVAVLTRPPAPAGRRRTLRPSPVHEAATAAGLEVITATRPHEEPALTRLRELDLDCAAVVAYGALLREPALSLPVHGWINLHFSLLPAWRGAAPVQYAVMAGDEISGATTFRIEAGLDTGPVFATMTERIRPRDTAGDLLDRLAHAGPALLRATLDAVAAGTADPIPQPAEGVSLAPTLTSADGRIDWRHPAAAIDRRIRGLTPAPGAWTRDDRGRYKLGPVEPVASATSATSATTGTGSTAVPSLAPGRVGIDESGVIVGTGSVPVRLTRIAPPGKPWMAASDWARGARHDIGFEVDE